MGFNITQEWFINIPGDFEHRVEEGNLVFWTKGITVITVVFRLPAETDKFELLNQIQSKIIGDTLETFVSTKGEIVGLGYTQVQKCAGAKDRLSLMTFTASDTSCLQTAFYLDDPNDLAWAKSMWESIVFHPSKDQALDQ